MGWQLRIELMGEFAHCLQGEIEDIWFDKEKNILKVKFKWVVQDFNYPVREPEWRIINGFTNYFLPLTKTWMPRPIKGRIKFQVEAGHQGVFLPREDSKYITLFNA